MSQTTYTDFPGKGLPGQRTDLDHGYARTYVNKTVEVPFGRIVAKVSGDEKGIKLPTVTGDNMLGAALRADGLALDGKYALNESVAVLRQGNIFLETEQDITPDDAVYVRFDGKAQRQTITFDVDFVSLNKINLKIDGIAMTEVVFDTDQATTIAALAAQILADFPQISTCTLDGRVLTLTGAVKGLDFVISDIVVTLGTAQAVGTVAETIASIALTETGKIRKDADSTTAVAVTKIEILSNGTAGDVVESRIKY